MSLYGSTEFVDYYEVLGIDPTAELRDIRRAYILKAKQHHPDAGGSIEAMQQLNKAYKTLKNSTAKATYDMLHNFHSGTTKPNDYRYSDGREVFSVSDMGDEEIDYFLDNLLAEYRNGPPKEKQTISQRLKNYLKKI